MALEILIVLLLTLVNGALAMSELAVVSARPARLRVMAEDGSTGATAALILQEHPGKFLSAVQIGITLVGVLSGAVSGATLGLRLSHALVEAGVPFAVANPLGVGLVVALITFLSLIIGELVPKQIALRDPESVAVLVAPTMRWIARLTTPLVWLLNGTGNLVLRILGLHGRAESSMSDEEVKMTMDEAETAGVMAPGERRMIAGVMRVADRTASALMTSRRDVELLDLSQSPESLIRQARASSRSRLPVRDGGVDEIIGVIAVRDLLVWKPAQGPLRDLVKEAPVVMDVTGAELVIEKLRQSPLHMLLVFDEFGHFEGIITPMDLLEAITGSLDANAEDEPAIVARDDGSYLVAGWMPVDEFIDMLSLRLPAAPDYDTVAGFVLDRLGQIPLLGETFEFGAWKFEVIDLDGLRIDKIIATKLG